jgi:orotidine-5'-phosphate decarboxylase
MEAKRLRDKLGSKLLIVTPGIRPGANVNESKDDQQRIITAQGAIADGADYLVIGRPISKAADPIKIISSLQQEIKQGLSS